MVRNTPECRRNGCTPTTNVVAKPSCRGCVVCMPAVTGAPTRRPNDNDKDKRDRDERDKRDKDKRDRDDKDKRDREDRQRKWEAEYNSWKQKHGGGGSSGGGGGDKKKEWERDNEDWKRKYGGKR